MKHFLTSIWTILLAIFIFTVSHINPAYASLDNQLQPIEFAPGRVIIKFKDTVASELKTRFLNKIALKQLEFLERLDYYILNVSLGSEFQIIEQLKKNPLIAKVELDGVVQAFMIPNDPKLSQQWGMYKIKAADSNGRSAWDISKGNSTIKIAILDTGIDQNHEDLKLKIVANKNFTNSKTVDDLYGHGTHVAGIAAAITNNAIGVAGVGYDSSLMNVKVLDDRGSGFYSWVANGIVWAVDNGAKVINMSLGGSSPSSVLEEAINYAWSKGVVIVAAAGNNGSNSPSYPAYYPNVIAVAATDNNDLKASWSNYGDWVDVAAPGVSIYSTLPNHNNKLRKKDYGFLSGTSMASPHVAGLAGLIWASGLCLDLDNNCVRNRIEVTSDTVPGSGSYWRFGRINALKALENAPSLQYYTLEVIKSGNGSGTIVSEPLGINCGDNCLAQYQEGMSITLLATANVDSVFGGWLGGCFGNEPRCTLILNSNSQVTAIFNDINSSGPSSLLVKSIDYVQYGGIRNNRHINVIISVVDDLNNPVQDAKISILLTNTTWGISWVGSGMTNSEGKITFILENAPFGCYSTTVTELMKSGLTWNNITPSNSVCK